MTILSFVILGSLLALGTAPQALLTLAMASFWALDVHPSIYHLGAMWIALWVGNMPGLALSAVSGVSDWNANGIDDWKEKFKPSWWVMQRFMRMGVYDAAILGAIGTAVRYSLFIPAIILGSLGQVSINYPKLAITCVMFCNLVGLIHYLTGFMLRGTRYSGYAALIAEGLSAGLICGALIV